MNTNFDQLKQVFLAAVERPPEQWDAYLDQACGDNAELRRQAAMLLKAHIEGQAERTAGEEARTTAYGSAGEQPGAVIGPYKLLEQIGEGGFGVVFMAEQTQPIRRKVAFKILKPGMDTRQVVARFEAERQALALMDHPNIAKVLDAGSTPTGRPYFVMELVKGVPITEFCDQNQLTPRQRLELFIAVCQAVQHAHQKGVIHRDLKPSNILVGVHDTTLVPKVIDFGIAKALGQELTDKTLFTGFAQMVGTPLYMSPEQAGHSSLDIDTRSDIYSLGVLLYELLTGTTPFDKERFKKAAYEEIRRIIREEEPPKPSTRLSHLSSPHAPREEPGHVTRSVTATLASVAAQRQTEPAKLTRLVRGDLDWIVMKALEKDRNRRYETANGFAMDLQRCLADEPVLACPPSAAYRFRKFARRNKAALTLASVVAASLLLLLVGLGVSNVLISQERNEKVNALIDKEAALQAAKASEQKAKQQEQAALESAKNAKAQHARAERYFLRAKVTLRDALMKALQGKNEWSEVPVSLRKQLAEDLLAFLQSFFNEASDDPTLRYETGWAYWSLAALHTSWGEMEKAQDLLRQSIAILDPLVKEFPAAHEYRQQLAWNNLALGERLAKTGQTKDAETAYRCAVENYEKLLLQFPNWPGYRADLATCHRALGRLFLAAGRTKEASFHLRQTVTLWEDSEGWYARGESLRAQGKLAEAITCYNKAIELDPKNTSALHGLGSALNELGNVDEAIACHKKLIDLDPQSVGGHSGLAYAFRAQGKLDQAIAYFRKTVELDPQRSNFHHDLGLALRSAGKLDEASACFKKAIDLNPNYSKPPRRPRPHPANPGQGGGSHCLLQKGDHDRPEIRRGAL